MNELDTKTGHLPTIRQLRNRIEELDWYVEKLLRIINECYFVYENFDSGKAALKEIGDFLYLHKDYWYSMDIQEEMKREKGKKKRGGNK